MDELKDRSLRDLLSELSRDTATLVHKEVELARVELGRSVALAGRRFAFVVVGAAVCYAGALTLTAAAVLAGVASGLSALASLSIVALLLLVGGGVLTQRGLAGLRAENLMPTETIQTLKDTAAWVRTQGR